MSASAVPTQGTGSLAAQTGELINRLETTRCRASTLATAVDGVNEPPSEAASPLGDDLVSRATRAHSLVNEIDSFLDRIERQFAG